MSIIPSHAGQHVLLRLTHDDSIGINIGISISLVEIKLVASTEWQTAQLTMRNFNKANSTIT
ncbi:hypothetical protein SAMD00023353_5000670 [Rosellinia necatrix]|uniref:Uncharacterized protein n=1 Tax=Rosellinia necatrix TaxID=77044 RepID=A0A1S8A9P5_ROSNE|nr:hypothetical protein SAMD00023353_5000670 [Rosellinia necatrix]